MISKIKFPAFILAAVFVIISCQAVKAMAVEQDSIKHAVRMNMQRVRLIVEDYAAKNNGVYPSKVADFLSSLPALVNPVNPAIPAVVDDPSNQPGQVIYKKLPTGDYEIIGNDVTGKPYVARLVNPGHPGAKFQDSGQPKQKNEGEKNAIRKERTKTELLDIALNSPNARERGSAVASLCFSGKKVAKSEVTRLLYKEKDMSVKLNILSLIVHGKNQYEPGEPRDTLNFEVDDALFDTLANLMLSTFHKEWKHHYYGIRTYVWLVSCLADNISTNKRAKLLFDCLIAEMEDRKNKVTSVDTLYGDMELPGLSVYAKKNPKNKEIVVQMARDILKTASGPLKDQLILLLGGLGEKSVAKEMLNVLKYSSNFDRRRGLNAYAMRLGILGDKEVTEMLKEDLKSSDDTHRFIAKTALEKAGYNIIQKDGKYIINNIGGTEK